MQCRHRFFFRAGARPKTSSNPPSSLNSRSAFKPFSAFNMSSMSRRTASELLRDRNTLRRRRTLPVSRRRFVRVSRLQFIITPVCNNIHEYTHPGEERPPLTSTSDSVRWRGGVARGRRARGNVAIPAHHTISARAAQRDYPDIGALARQDCNGLRLSSEQSQGVEAHVLAASNFAALRQIS